MLRQQRHHCPAGGADGDELVLAMWEVAFEIFLDGFTAGLHVP